MDVPGRDWEGTVLSTENPHSWSPTDDPYKQCVAHVAVGCKHSTFPPSSVTVMSSSTDCSNGGGADTYFSLRIASVFVILATSTFGAFFPVIAKRSKWMKVPNRVFESVFWFPFLVDTILILSVDLLNISAPELL